MSAHPRQDIQLSISAVSTYGLYFDPERGWAYYVYGGGQVSRVNALTGREESYRTSFPVGIHGHPAIDKGGELYFGWGDANFVGLAAFEPVTLQQTRVWGVQASLDHPDAIAVPRWLHARHGPGYDWLAVAGVGPFGRQLGLFDISGGGIAKLAKVDIPEGSPESVIIDQDQNIWVLATNETSITKLYRYRLSGGPGTSELGVVSSLDLHAQMPGAAWMAYFEDDHSVLLGLTYPDYDTVAKLDLNSGTIAATVSGLAAGPEAVTNFKQGVVSARGGDKLFIGGNLGGQIAVLDAATLAVEATYDGDDWRGGLATLLWHAQVYEPVTHAVLTLHDDLGPTKLFLDRIDEEGIGLDAVVSDISGLCGLGPGNIDADSLSGETVRGYVLSRTLTGRQAIEPLMWGYAFDVVESDFKARFQPRGAGPVATISEDDLGAAPPGNARVPALVEVFQQEVEAPGRVEVAYLDPARDHQEAVQSAKRIETAVATRQVVRLGLPIVFTADEAKKVAARALKLAWTERVEYELALGWRWLRLDPTDVVEFTRGDTILQARLVQTDLGADGVIACKALRDEVEAYVPAGLGLVGSPTALGFTPTTTAGGGNAPESEAFLMDIPVLRDQDDDAGFYVAAARNAAGGAWPGASLYKSADGVAYDQVLALLSEATAGRALTALPPAGPTTVFDTASTLDVTLVTGALESRSELEVLNGANVALLGQEVIQWRTATQLSDSVWRLSNLLRGRRGTEWAVGTHGIGEAFVVLDPKSVRRVAGQLAELDLARFYKAVTFGKALNATPGENFINTGVGLKPYAPVHLSATVDAQDNVVLAWVRRTRLGGAWRDGTGMVPLAEESEAYEVDVLDAPGGNLVRTLASTAPSVVYESADVQADFSPTSSSPLALVNPGAEAGDTSGWTSTLGGLAVRSGDPAPYEGSYYFMGGTSPETIARQDVAVPAAKEPAADAGEVEARLTWYQTSWAGKDQAEMRLVFYDAAMTQLGATVAAGLESPTAWTARTLQAPVPANTRTIRITQRMKRTAGTNNDGYIDAVTLDLVEGAPVPDEITFVVYQMSAALGRGTGQEATLALR